MKNVKFYISMLAVTGLLFTSCSKDDPGTEPEPGGEQMVTLAFKGALQQFNKAMATKQSENPIPECNENDVPDHVRVAIMGPDGNWVSGSEFIEIDVIQPASDSDGDGAENNLTMESADLELPAGNYSLEYFGVFNNENELIWLAPRGDEDYGPANFGNFVEDPLPISIDLEVGTKHYVEVEVLCYDEAEARQYGYLFFDFEQVPLTYLCIFGNECDEDGRHFPSHFRVMIWEYPTVDGSTVEFTPETALVNEVNEVRTLESGLLQADPLCFPLPDRDGENLFYGEIYTINAEGEETLIRRGDFTDEQTKSEEFNIDNAENLRNYWHFREGRFCGEDSSPCMLSSLAEDIVDDFDDPAAFSDYTDTEYDPFETSDDRYGEYLITDDASEFYSGFTSEPYDGNMLVFDGDPERELAYYTIQTPEVCAGDRYYVTMDLRDISDPDLNNAVLRVQYRSAPDDGTTIIGQFSIDELDDNNSGVEGWKTVGFTMEARSDGQLYFLITDQKRDESGNDFAIDNVRISNDPTILNGITEENLNPRN